MKSFFIVVICMLSILVNANPLEEQAQVDMQVLLGNRDLVSDDTTLWDKENFFARTTGKTPEVRIFSKSHRVHDSLKNIEILYSSKNKVVSLFKESGAYTNGEHIHQVLKAKHYPVIIIETRRQSTGATGDGSDGKSLYVYVFDNEKIENRSFKLTENWWSGSFNQENKTYYLGRGNPMYLSLLSLSENNVYSINVSNLSVVQDLGIVSEKTKPSYDCKKAKTQVEMVICFDAALSALDSIMSETYAKNKNSRPIKKSQKAWLKERDGCGAGLASHVKQCLSKHYNDRILALLQI